jgi:predicted Rossmann fold nucleotide-binding protein DprA/Smf involved in DNA uptake
MTLPAISPDTETVLLLCGRFGGERAESHKPLSTREYAEFAKWLNSKGMRPSDLMTARGASALNAVSEARIAKERVEALLGRGTAMALAVERWNRGGLWVISRGDIEFPWRLKRRLKHAAPPLLYGAGDPTLLDVGGLAIVGSRDASDEGLAFTQDVARACANDGICVVSGGARGVDAAAMSGAADAGGYVIGVLANDLLKQSLARTWRAPLREGRIVLISPFHPEAGFSAGAAMGRNRFIYALSDRALVIDSALSKGGTWEGAVENLKNAWVPLYVRSPGEGAGNTALIAEGGRIFDRQSLNGAGLKATFEREESANTGLSVPNGPQASLLSNPSVLSLRDGDGQSNPDLFVREVLETDLSGKRAAAELYELFLVHLVGLLKKETLTAEVVAERLGLQTGQARSWLERAVKDGLVGKHGRPSVYELSSGEGTG